MYPSAFV